ncbi:Yae1 family protein [Aspergillus saccharolyticus JOP 1030-1]|uniref:Protein YAE1 n=1 Tax=Aspergillus saccharolyticus JOP 1030-1 TaxID=1450539 RepID=A0A318ZJS4_9EURO|nr:hypothetical protein BP01DRAFT_198636 [Aspergillus saccharolyticus JOP 1030-1]PYH47831.1 hypothetical protein BP01DRAFT_198636 [Aspergillus saccharolyticus JOP 1030-1]
MSTSLDEIFGSSPPHQPAPHPQPHHEPSDLPSLRRQHVTAGYRDGLAASKSTQVQAGFDAGFPVGAQLGMRVGTVLGVLEGAIRGLEGNHNTSRKKTAAATAAAAVSKGGATSARTGTSSSKDRARTAIGFEEGAGESGAAATENPSNKEARTTTTTTTTTPLQAKRAELLRLYQQAVRELDVRKVFEGVVATDEGDATAGGEGEREMPETKLARKAEEVVAAWERRVQVALWEENMDALEVKEQEGEAESS